MSDTFPLKITVPGTTGATIQHERTGAYGVNLSLIDPKCLNFISQAAETTGVYMDTSGIDNSPGNTFEVIGDLAGLQLFSQAATELAETQQLAIPA
jgi:hypothetical protein